MVVDKPAADKGERPPAEKGKSAAADKPENRCPRRSLPGRAVRLRLDINQLPKPFQIAALGNKGLEPGLRLEKSGPSCCRPSAAGGGQMRRFVAVGGALAGAFGAIVCSCSSSPRRRTPPYSPATARCSSSSTWFSPWPWSAWSAGN